MCWPGSSWPGRQLGWLMPRSSDVTHLEQVRSWFGRPLWDMEPADAYFGKVLRGAAKGTRLGRSQALRTYFLFLEIRHKIEIHQLDRAGGAVPGR
jgi:hypothetical protein